MPSRRHLALLPLLIAWPAASIPAQAPGRDSLAPRIDSVFQRFAVAGSPGCAVGVARGSALVYARGYGLASIELGVPIIPETVFDIGSVSKQFTAMAIVLLAQDGKLSLDDEIQRFVPAIPRYAKPITLRHLLHHTSGLRDYIDLLGWSGVGEEAVTGDREALDVLSRQRATNFTPGSEYLYSNSGFFLLSLVVKQASGNSLRQFAAERIFGPLGMTSTFYLDDHAEIVPGKASSYVSGSGGQFRLAPANWEQTGDGGVQTTVVDLLKWDQNFSSGRVGGMAAIRELETTGVLNDGKPITYALGQVVDRYGGLRRVSHGGSWAGFRAQLTRFPEQQTSILALCNLGNAAPAALTNRVAGILLAGQFSAPLEVASAPGGQRVGGNPSGRLQDYIGTYHSDELLADWTVTLAGDSLRLRAGPIRQETLVPVGPAEFAGGGRIRFVEEGGRVTGLTINTRGLRDFRLTRVIPRP